MTPLPHQRTRPLTLFLPTLLLAFFLLAGRPDTPAPPGWLVYGTLHDADIERFGNTT